MMEAQVRYLVDLLRRMDEAGVATVEPRPEVEREWDAGVQRALARTVWNTGGCSSWYLDAHGKNTVLWPRSTFTFRRRLAEFDVAAYEVAGPTDSNDSEKVSA